MRKIKIAIVIPNLMRGGAEKVLTHLVNHIDRQKFEPVVFCMEKKGELLSLINSDIFVENLNCSRAYFLPLFLKKKLEKHKPDILIGWMGHINAVLGFFKFLLPKNITLMCRESSIPSRFINEYRFPWLFRFLYKGLRNFDALICQSEAMKEDLVKNFTVRREKIRVIYNPVVKSYEQTISKQAIEFISSAGKTLLFVGRFSREKRAHLCIELMQFLPASYKLIMVGYGDMTGTITEMIKKEGLTERILLDTNCQNPSGYYTKTDCIVMTSDFEGFPNVLIEANSFGCPSVVYRTKGGAAEIVDSDNGIYLPDEENNTMEVFSKAVQEVCNNEEKYERKMISSNTLAKYDIKRVVDEYAGYIEITKKKKDNLK